jgi:predicted transcriptional regulator
VSKLAETKVYLPWAVLRAVDQLAARNRCSRSELIRAAVQTFMSPDGPEQLEAALGRRLDRLSRQVERLERDLAIGNEALGLFVQAWLKTTPAVPEAGRAAADAKGRERYLGFVSALGRRLASGKTLSTEILEESANLAGKTGIQPPPA